MNRGHLLAGACALAAVVMLARPAGAVSGAAYTTFNAHVDGSSKDVCKNSAINCNLYGDKKYVWLNGGPSANGLGPQGQYFFAVLVPGGQPNPNDGGPKNLSDDYDAYTNRTFTVGSTGEVTAYGGSHWLDDGKSGPKPNNKPPYIRLYPYADTTNPGGVYIMAICYLGVDGTQYPVDPRDCKYDAFKVKKGKQPVQFKLSGYKSEDRYCDGICSDPDSGLPQAGDPGLPGWTITIDGTGPDGAPIHVTTLTDGDGYWSWQSIEYFFDKGATPQQVNLTVCEVQVPGFTQSCPADGGCYTVVWNPPLPGYEEFEALNFGNWRPVTIKGCVVRAPESDCSMCQDGDPVQGWTLSLTENGTVVETVTTGPDGCYTWPGRICGISYDLHDGGKDGWEECGPADIVFPISASGDSYDHTYCNRPLEGCTPGFWQGGSNVTEAGGKWLWDEVNDPDWPASGGAGFNPYVWGTLFNSFFTPYAPLNGVTMFAAVDGGGGSNDYDKAARDLVAAYLNASWGMGYPYTTAELKQMWTDAVNSGDFMSLHNELDAANNAYFRDETDGGPRCPISAGSW